MGYVLEDNKIYFVYDPEKELDLEIVNLEGFYKIVADISKVQTIKCPGCGDSIYLTNDLDITCNSVHVVTKSGMVYVKQES